MNRLAQEAVIVGLARRLNDHGSWSGETHIQKAAYLLHGLTGIPFTNVFNACATVMRISSIGLSNFTVSIPEICIACTTRGP